MTDKDRKSRRHPTGAVRALRPAVGIRFALAACCVLTGCGGSSQQRSESLVLATTTSTRDSGLLDELLPRFESREGIEVKVVAVGSGQALEMGRRGDADVLMTHAPEAEAEFIAQGYGVERRPIMHNDFVLVGPAGDPAGIASLKHVQEALRRIAESDSQFVSRGDQSGTHMKEQMLWKLADGNMPDERYLKVGSGMAATLRVANEKQAYTLSDRGTFLAQRPNLDLRILFENDPPLNNPYAVLLLAPERFPELNHEAARKFAAYLESPETQRRIAAFGRDRFDLPLFFPDCLPAAD